MKAGKVRIKDKNKGYKELFRRIYADGPKAQIEVGVFGKDALQPSTNDPSVTVLDVATFNEFGLGVPERSFIRAYFDENVPRLLQMQSTLMKSVVTGQRTKAQVVNILGLKMVGEIQARIAAGISPPNAASTIARKGSSTPLIDSGQLRASISFRVRESRIQSLVNKIKGFFGFES